MNNGISRNFRANKALASDYIQLDERTISDLITSTLTLAQSINYYNENNKIDGNWESFFLSDPLFMMVKITATNISKYKITNDQLKKELTNSANQDAIANNYLDNFFQLIQLVSDWNDLLIKSDDTRLLKKEVSGLKKSMEGILKILKNDSKNDKLKSVFDKRIKNYSFIKDEIAAIPTVVSYTVTETFDNIYAQIVFFKERVLKKFNEEIKSSQNHVPHIGLLLTFYKLFELVRQDVNTLTKRHLDFYYRELLEQKQKNIVEPHSAMVACFLNKGIEDLLIPKGAPFNFDVGNGQKMVFYADENTHINQAEITDVKTIFKDEIEPFDSMYSIDTFKYNVLYESDILKSLQLRSEIQAESYKDFPLIFGEKKHKQCDLGFIISSPILILERGVQKLVIEFKLNNDFFDEGTKTSFDLLVEEIFVKNHKKNGHPVHDEEKEKKEIRKIELHKFLREVFNIYITTQDGWAQIDYSKTKYVGDDRIIKIEIHLESHQVQMISFDPLIHEGGYDTDWPCIKLLLNNYATYHPYIILKEWEIEYIRIETEVSNVTNLGLSNANGNIDNTIPFVPFGAIPEKGSFLRIQNPLIIQRNLSELELSINWNVPQLEGGFDTYYEAYQMGIKNDSFKAYIARTRNLSQNEITNGHVEFDLFKFGRRLLERDRTIIVDLNDFELNNGIFQLNGEVVDYKESIYIILSNPNIGFGHSIFPEIYAKSAMQNSGIFKKQVPLPRQPYVPVIDQLKVRYVNTAKENMLRKQDDTSTSIKLFHVHPFGHVKVFPGPVKSPCYLIPQIKNRGNLLIGLKEIRPDDIISIGFELIAAVLFNTVLELSRVTWKYLYNNEWYDLTKYILEDSTLGFRKSGIVKIEVPKSIQLDHTRLTSGKWWISATYGNKMNDDGEDINSRIKNIFIQAIPLSSKDPIPDHNHARDIKRKSLKINYLGTNKIERVFGPMNFILTENIEDDVSFYSRVSELLRHKNRGVANWDIERILLEKFHQIEKVRVYGRNNYPKELVQGSNVQIVVIPKNDLNGASLFQPRKLDVDTLEEIKKYAKRFMPHYAQVEVCNPVFEKLKVRCRVAFTDESRGSFLRYQLNKELVDFLSPNLKGFDSEDLFEKIFTKTGIFNFIKTRAYVKAVTNFSVIQLIEVDKKHRIINTEDGKGSNSNNTRDILQTISAYAILTSVDRHHIEIDASEKDLRGIGDIAIGSDFIIADSIGNYIDDKNGKGKKI